MVRTRMLSRACAAVFVVGLFVAGCSNADGDPTPTPEPTVTESGRESPTPEPTTPAASPTPWPEPTRPAAMERDDVEGAKAAAEYFLALFTYAHLTGDLNAWIEMSHQDCNFCADVAQDIESLYSTGGRADGPTFKISRVEAAPPDDDYEFFSVWIDADEGASARYDADGAVTESFEPSALEVDMALAQVDGEWRVRGVVGRGEESGDGHA